MLLCTLAAVGYDPAYQQPRKTGHGEVWGQGVEG